MSMFNVRIYISKIRHLLSGVIFRFLPNLRRLNKIKKNYFIESSKVWKKPKYNS